jgi:hypothetical protein
MPRNRPLKPRIIPQIERPQALSQLSPSERDDFARLLGFSKLADNVASELLHFIVLAKATRPAVAGLTRQSRAAELKRWEKKLRKEQQTGRPNVRLRQLIADPRLGLDIETFLELAPLVAAPSSQLLAAVEACRRKIAGLPRVNPQSEARLSAGGVAVWFFLLFSADDVRDEAGAWWRFVLAFLEAAAFPTVKLHQHAETLRPQLDTLRVQASGLATAVRAGLRRAPSLSATTPNAA